MKLRTALLAIAATALLVVIVASLQGAGIWPALIWLVPIVAALAFERRRYGQAALTEPAAGWQVTDEQFIDDSSGRLVRVWFHPSTGERRYVEVRQD